MDAPKWLAVGLTELDTGVMVDGGISHEPSFTRDEVLEFGGEMYVYKLVKMFRAAVSPIDKDIPVISV